MPSIYRGFQVNLSVPEKTRDTFREICKRSGVSQSKGFEMMVDRIEDQGGLTETLSAEAALSLEARVADLESRLDKLAGVFQ